MAALTTDVDFCESSVEAVRGRLITFANACRVTVRAQNSNLVASSPMQLVGGLRTRRRLEREPALSALGGRPRVPGLRQRLSRPPAIAAMYCCSGYTPKV